VSRANIDPLPHYLPAWEEGEIAELAPYAAPTLSREEVRPGTGKCECWTTPLSIAADKTLRTLANKTLAHLATVEL
jgi:hypothetical protein